MSPRGRVWDGCNQFGKRFERELQVRNHTGTQDAPPQASQEKLGGVSGCQREQAG